MKTIKILAKVICVTLLCLSCDNISEKTSVTLSENVTLVIDPIYSPRTENSFLLGDYGSYLNYLKDSDYIVGISASKANALSSHKIKSYCGPRYNYDTKSSDFNSFEVKIDNKIFSHSAVTKSTFNEQALYGKNLTFSITPKVPTKSNGCDIELYVPEMINITKPSTEAVENLLPLCYYDGFKLCWNSDSKNKNGVIVIIEWIGEMVIGNDIPETHVRRVCVFDDTGESILPNDIFEDIPDTAVCHLTLLRGNAENINIDNESFNIMVESHEFLNFVLIREIKHI